MGNVNKKEVLFVLTDKWCEWEGAYAVAVINCYSEEHTVKTISIDGQAQRSMGGVMSLVDYDMPSFDGWDNVSMVIMPGGYGWEENEYIEIQELVTTALQKKIPVCAICGATTFLCRHGFLNHVKHTGDSREWFLKQKEYGYTGETHYVESQVVYDGGIMTANETAAVEFAYEIFNILGVDEPEEREKWLERFKWGDVRNGVQY